MPFPFDIRVSRAGLAGVGTAASLVAAAGVTAIVVTGLVTFSTWPGELTRPAPEITRLAVTPAGGATFTQAAYAATPAAPGAVRPSSAALGDTPTPPRRSTGADGEAGSGIGSAIALAAAQAALADASGTATASPRAMDAVADATQGTTRAAGDQIGASARGVAATTASLAPRTSRFVAKRGSAGGDFVARNGAAASELMRRLPIGEERVALEPTK